MASSSTSNSRRTSNQVRKYYYTAENNRTQTISVKVLREIKYYQKTTHNLIPKLPFSRLVREVMSQYRPDFRIQSLALSALQVAAEGFLVDRFIDSYNCAKHAKRATMNCKDMDLVRTLQRNDTVR